MRQGWFVWVRFGVWLAVSILLPLICYVALRAWLTMFLVASEGRIALVYSTFWLMVTMAFILGQVVRGIMRGGWDAWLYLAGPKELRTRGTIMLEVAARKEGFEPDRFNDIWRCVQKRFESTETKGK